MKWTDYHFFIFVSTGNVETRELTLTQYVRLCAVLVPWWPFGVINIWPFLTRQLSGKEIDESHVEPLTYQLCIHPFSFAAPPGQRNPTRLQNKSNHFGKVISNIAYCFESFLHSLFYVSTNRDQWARSGPSLNSISYLQGKHIFVYHGILPVFEQRAQCKYVFILFTLVRSVRLKASQWISIATTVSANLQLVVLSAEMFRLVITLRAE